jgi:hypothetical protein
LLGEIADSRIGTEKYKMSLEARHQWLTPVILATQEAENRRIIV